MSVCRQSDWKDRYESRDLRLEKNLQTYKDERSSWSARVALQLSGRYEPYRLICRWLNVKRPGRCAPWGAQGVDTAYGSPYKGQTIRQSDVRPEAFSASFQTSEGEHQHAFLRKDRFEIRDTRRMRKIIIKGVFVTSVCFPLF